MNGIFKKDTLDNGLKVLTEKLPGSVSASIGVWVDSGSRDEDPSICGVSHFIEHMIFKGTMERSALDIAKAFDRMGGFSNAFTSKETTCFYAKVLNKHVDQVLELFADILQNSTFATEEVQRERQVVMQEIMMVEDSPEELVHELFALHFWGDTGLGRPVLGTRESISRIDSQVLRQYVNDVYRAPKIMVAAAGNLDHQKFLEKCQVLFGKVPNGFRTAEEEDVNPATGLRVIRKDIEQAHIIVGFPAVSAKDPMRYPVALLNIILGGSMSSRLFQEIRERRGLAYSVYSYLSAYQNAGMMGVYAAVSPSQVGEVTRLINDITGNLAEELVEPEELEAARDHLKGGLLLTAESPDNRMTRLAKNELTHKRFVPYQEVVDAIDSVTVEDIQQACRRITDAGNFTLVLGPVEEKDLA